jgi:hypothetical protein
MYYNYWCCHTAGRAGASWQTSWPHPCVRPQVRGRRLPRIPCRWLEHVCTIAPSTLTSCTLSLTKEGKPHFALTMPQTMMHMKLVKHLLQRRNSDTQEQPSAFTLIPMLFFIFESRYNDLVLAGRAVQGSGPGALDSQEDSVTRRYREAVNNGFTTVRMFASGGEGDGKALESAPGADMEPILAQFHAVAGTWSCQELYI